MLLIDSILLQLWWNHAPLKGDWNRSGIFENLIHCFFFYFTERSVLFKEYNVLMNIHRMHVSFIPCKTLLKPASPITERLSKRSVLKQRFTKQGVSHWKQRLAKRSVSHFVFYDNLNHKSRKWRVWHEHVWWLAHTYCYANELLLPR